MNAASSSPPDASADTHADVSADIATLRAAISSTIVGQNEAIDQLLIGLMAQGHVLLEGVPGVAKTLLARALAAATGLVFGRVQFTPDLMPADLCGTRIYSPETKTWEVHKGPIFCQVLLADEINRTPPKTQAALLEAMEERQVTLDGTRYPLPPPFFVVATQNPLEFEGTYPLPEAQTDRFLLKVVISYPEAAAELQLLERGAGHRAELPRGVLSADGLARLQASTAAVRVDDAVRRYVLALLTATRTSTSLRLGASPRAGLMLLAAAQAQALLNGRQHVLPEDIKACAVQVMRHRLSLSTDAELDGLTVDGVILAILDSVPILEESGAAS